MRRYLQSILVLLVLLNVCCYADTAVGRWRADWARLLKEGKYSQAAARCFELLRVDPENTLAFSALQETVLAAAHDGKLAATREACLDTLTDVDGADGDRLVALTMALLHAADSRYAAAGKLLDRVELEAADDVRVHCLRAHLLLQRGETDGASSCIETALEVDPFSVDARLCQVRVLIQRERFNSAQEALRNLRARTQLYRPSAERLERAIRDGIEATGQGVIRGRCVFAADGRPVKGAVVQVVEWVRSSRGRRTKREDASHLSTTTDAEGRFHIDALPPGTYIVSAFYKGMVADATRNVRITTDRHSEFLQLPLRPGGVLDVVVKDEQTGRAVVTAQVTIEGRRDSELQTDTDATGVATFQGLLRDGYKIEVRAPGYMTRKGFVTFVSGPETSLRTVTLEMKKGVLLEALVLDERGRPLRGADVQLLTHDYRKHFRAIAPLETDAMGTTVINVIGAGEKFRLLAGKPEHGFAVTDVMSGEAGRSIHATLRLPSRRVLRGTVRDEQGHPLAQARIYCKLDTDAPVDREVIGFQTLSDAAGKFKLHVWNEGKYWLKPHKSGYVVQGLARARVKGAVTDVTLTMQRAESIAGRIVDEAGQPVKGAFIYALNYKGLLARSDEDGHFRLEGLVPGQYDLYVVHKRYRTLKVKGVRSASTDNGLVLKGL